MIFLACCLAACHFREHHSFIVHVVGQTVLCTFCTIIFFIKGKRKWFSKALVLFALAFVQEQILPVASQNVF